MSDQEHYEKGMEHFGDDRMDEAIQELHRAIEINPCHGDALHALAMCYYHHQNLDQALQYGKLFLEQEPRNPLAYTSLSMIYQAKGMVPEAEEMGEKARGVEQAD